MSDENLSLMQVFSGWDGYQKSLVSAIAPRSPEQLAYRLAPESRTAGEIALHLAFGRIDWFGRMGAPGSAELGQQVELVWKPGDAFSPDLTRDAGAIVHWLEASWQMVESNLVSWTTADLGFAYPLAYRGITYSISRQWTIWRIMAHDIHHGGQLSALFDAQGITLPELGDLGGHLTEPPRAEASSI